MYFAIHQRETFTWIFLIKGIFEKPYFASGT